MPKLPVVSGSKLIKAFKKMGFEKVRQTGSHIVMKHTDGRIATIPNHKEIKKGTLRNGILKPLRACLESSTCVIPSDPPTGGESRNPSFEYREGISPLPLRLVLLAQGTVEMTKNTYYPNKL